MFKRSSTSKNAPLFMIFILLVGVAFFLSFIKSNEFSFEQKPIHPLCFSRAADLYRHGDDTALDLSQCRHDTAVIAEQDGTLMAENPVDSDHPDSYTGYSRYRLIGKMGEKFIATHEWNGGGSGHFSEIFSVQFNPPMLKVEENYATGGDRCHYGIVSAKIEGDLLLYEQNTTPNNFFEIASNPHQITGLESCSVCCAGVAEYSFHPESQETKLLYLKLDPEKRESPQDGGDLFQACFDKIYNSYIERGLTKLDAQQIETFKEDFYKECLPLRKQENDGDGR